MKAPPLPRYQGGDLRPYLNDLVAKIELAIARTPIVATGGSVTGSGWNVTTPVINRTIDVSTATLTQTVQALGTLIADLKAGDAIA